MGTMKAKLQTVLMKLYRHETKAKVIYDRVIEARGFVQSYNNELEYCPCCDQPITDVVTTYNTLTAVQVLYILVEWCLKNRRYEFRSDEVSSLIGHTQYANLNHLDRFAGIVYRPIDKKTGKQYRSRHYGVNLGRAFEFLRGKRPAPVQIITKRLTGERIASTEKYIHDFPSIKRMLNEDGSYDPKRILPDTDSVPRKDGLPTVPEALQRLEMPKYDPTVVFEEIIRETGKLPHTKRWRVKESQIPRFIKDHPTAKRI